MNIEYQKIKVNSLTENDIGETIRYGEKNNKKFGFVFNVSKRGVELLFAENKMPLLIGNVEDNNHILEKIIITKN